MNATLPVGVITIINESASLVSKQSISLDRFLTLPAEPYELRLWDGVSTVSTLVPSMSGDLLSAHTIELGLKDFEVRAQVYVPIGSASHRSKSKTWGLLSTDSNVMMTATRRWWALVLASVVMVLLSSCAAAASASRS